MNHNLDYRKFVIGGIAVVIVIVYTVRLFVLQIMSDDYRKSADSNAFLKKIEYPSRGVISDRNGELLVYNQPSYDIMVVMNEAKDRLDTLEFCQALGISKAYFIKRMNDIKDRSKNPGYSRFTQQLFMAQLSNQDFSVFRERIVKHILSAEFILHSDALGGFVFGRSARDLWQVMIFRRNTCIFQIIIVSLRLCLEVIGCISEIKINRDLFCISLDLHYLCIRYDIRNALPQIDYMLRSRRGQGPRPLGA